MGTKVAIAPPDSHRDHLVGFYTGEERLIGDVARFASSGLAAGEVVMLIVTPGRAAAFETELLRAGVEVAAAKSEGRLFFDDAAQTLSRLMANGQPDEQRFLGLFQKEFAQG